MKPEQLGWTDKDWAKHLQCKVADVPRFKKYLEENFVLGIWQEGPRGLKYAQIEVRHDTPSGSVRFIPMATSGAFDWPLDKMVEYTNNVFVPSLELKPFVAGMHNVPTRVLQMLHIKNNQK